MPVILDPGAESAWLDLSTPRSELRDILRGLPAESTGVAEVGRTVNDARYDGPECLAPPAPSAQETLF
jgi:putative SOS response-associated peptidase YedK